MSEIIIRRRIAAHEFTDRVDPRKAFWNRFNKMVGENRSTFITYYGAGGVGKSSLLNKLMDEFDGRQNEFADVVCLFHDFINGGDYRMILNNWKSTLKERGCEFPFFETGDFVLSMKQGLSRKELDEPQIKSWIEKNKWMSLIKSKLEQTHGSISNIRAAARETDFTDRVLGMFPGITTISTLMNVISKTLAEIERQRRLDDHEELRRELYFRAEERNTNVLNELLPKLFAQDVRDWAGESKKLIIFLDTYELLTGTSTIGDREWWIKDDDEDRRGLFFELPPTLWVIGGRNKIRWTDDIDDESARYFIGELKASDLDQHLIKALSKFDSDYFLTKAGIWSKELRDRIYDVTGGYPLYLDLCVDVYEEYVNNRGQVPTAEDFGQSRERIIDRLMKYMNDDMRLTVQCLSLLGKWTNEMARRLVAEFDPNLYADAKKFSFIQGQSVQLGETTVEVYRFDRTLQKILYESMAGDEDFIYLIEDTREAAYKYFDELLVATDNLQAFGFYLKMWSEMIIRFADDAEQLEDQYIEHIEEGVQFLSDCGQFGAASEVVSMFLDCELIARDPNGLIHAFFDGEMGIVKNAAGEYQEALNYQQAAYEKYLAALGEEHPDTVMMMNNLAVTLGDLGRYEEALTLKEQVLELRKKILGDEHPDTIRAMHNLALTLHDLGRYDEALTLKEKVLELLKKVLGEEHPDTILAMSNLAVTLGDLGRYEEALTLKEQVLELFKKILGEEHPHTIMAMNNLAGTLRDLGRYEEALTLKEQVLELRRKVLGDEHPDTISAMNNLASNLNDLKRYDEALQINSQALALSKRVLGDEHPDTVWMMNSRAVTLSDSGRYAEALTLDEQVLELQQKILGEEHPDTIAAMINLAETLNYLGRYDEALTLNTQAMERSRKILGEEHPYTVEAMRILAETQKKMNAGTALELRRGQRVELTKDNPSLQKIAVKLEWSADFDIDASAFLLRAGGHVADDADFIFYNNTAHQSGCIELDEGMFSIEPAKIPDAVSKIDFALTIDGDHTFNQASNIKLYVIDADNDKQLMHFNCGNDLSSETAIVVGELYRHNGKWKFKAIGAGFNGGLESLCKQFGVDIE